MLQWLSEHMLPCLFQENLGLPCPGCGLQRSAVALLQGRFWDSIQLYPALIPMIATLSWAILIQFVQWEKASKVTRLLAILTFSILLINYLFRLIQALA